MLKGTARGFFLGVRGGGGGGWRMGVEDVAPTHRSNVGLEVISFKI